METKRTTIFGHWSKALYSEAELGGTVMPYTILTVHEGWVGPRVNEMKLFLAGKAINVAPGKRLTLVSDERGKPLSLWDENELLWEEPPYLPFVAIYKADLIIGGPSDRIAADVIGIAHWPDDSWIQVYCPPEMIAQLMKILPRATRSGVVTQSANRTYHVLYMTLGDWSVTQVASQIGAEIPNAIFLEQWS